MGADISNPVLTGITGVGSNFTVQQLILAELRVISTLIAMDAPLGNLEALNDLRIEILGEM